MSGVWYCTRCRRTVNGYIYGDECPGCGAARDEVSPLA